MALAILVFTHLPNDRVPHLVLRIGDDKLRHVLSYGLFSALLFAGLRPWLVNPVKALAWVAAIGTAFAIVDELTQPLTGRTCSLLDFLASFGGTLSGGCLMFLVAMLPGPWLKSGTAPVVADPGKPTTAPHP